MVPVEHNQKRTRLLWSLVLLSVGLLLIGWLLNTPKGLLGKADAVGYAVCHRIDARSFHLGDRTIPLCARCSGMYLGAVLCLTYQALRSPRSGGMPPKRVVIVLGLFVVGFAIDGLNSYLHLGFFKLSPTLYEPQNWLRMLTGFGMGIAIGAVIYPAFNQTIWRNWDPSPALPGFNDMGALLLLALITALLMITENPLILYPLALISAAGVLVLLTLVYAMILSMIFRLENRFNRFNQLWLILVGGFGVALMQIVVLDTLRFILTGTWEGFNLG
jgi:uncharacterized membrane protein